MFLVDNVHSFKTRKEIQNLKIAYFPMSLVNPIPTGGGAHCAPPVGFLLITFLFIIQLA